MSSSQAILSGLQPAPGRPSVTIRQAGDRQILVEYGAAEVDLHLNFRVQALWQLLKDSPIHGVTDTAAGFRSLLISFDPSSTSRSRLISEVADREHSAPDIRHLVLPSRDVVLPIAFDDSSTQQAIEMYRLVTRANAPNVTEGDNIDYIVHFNGFDDREEFIDTFLSTTWWNGFMGYFPSLPSLFAMDPRTQITVPKYNPARMWTPEGAVGIGGPCLVLYPIEAPGSYQIFGRTLQMRLDRGPQDADDHPVSRNLLHVGDRVTFERVTERELIDLRLRVFEGTYEYRITDSPYAVAEYAKTYSGLTADIADVAAKRQSAATRVEIP